MIGAGPWVTWAAPGATRRVPRRARRPATPSTAARTRTHGGRESRAGGGTSLGSLGASTAAGAGVPEGAVPRAAEREDVVDATLVGRADGMRSPTRPEERRACTRRSVGPEGGRVWDRVTSCCVRPEARLPRTGRTTAAAAPAGAVPRRASSPGVASAGACATATDTDCTTGDVGAGTAAGGGAAWRAGSRVNGST
jgi:hypothetical protein